MNRLALVASLLLAACAEPASLYPEPAPAPATWLEPGQLGYEEQLKWGMPLPEGFAVVVLPPDLFLLQCQGLYGDDCTAFTYGTTVLEEARILIRSDVTPAEFDHLVLHEMGHLLRGQGGHIDDTDACPEGSPGRLVMCAWGSGATLWPEAEDFAFVHGE